MSIHEKIAQLKEYFSVLPGWEEKYAYIISLGKSLSPLADEYKTDEYLVRGCQSNVWLRSYEQDGNVCFEADSDALITKGIVALLLFVVSGHSNEDIRDTDFSFLDDIGLKSHLSMARANGLQAMIDRITHV
ncbi:MAG: SufE family protein [Candidatus Magasanikbacteria bacterium]|uniref:Fe-S metabolism protein SufE n=1 Tax=Candidatus Magasanikbacteria bacterium CG10_big_fil_rev_8_21_14_0_10_38_6 TaxID=1974647 RepID=A0A2M6P1P7_9BACT|nr:SufE family protein [Candidatus Magasanikbacteria bacterium]NCS72235.1 SufE family protein [Candidatus Magasanikbacteria bacterium]PIR77479.1 MAG: Fe-S metabolism protein SufE [Candidatus Magasanikbacteria bacterium CG10_big_fil_rev_8_21_14_0_10_38_6]